MDIWNGVFWNIILSGQLMSERACLDWIWIWIWIWGVVSYISYHILPYVYARIYHNYSGSFIDEM